MRYTLYTATLNSTTALVQMDGWSVKPGVQRATIIPGGLIDVAHIGIAGATPSVSLTTRDLSTFLTTITISAGLACTASSTFALQERLDGGTLNPTSTATHETVTAAKGFVYPTSITASQEGNDGATLEGTFIPLWNGTLNPLVWNTGVAINTLTVPSFASRYFLGPVYHNGTVINGVTNVTVNPGINYTPRAFAGDPYAKIGSIVTRTPSISFTVTEAAAAGTLTTLFGSAVNTSFAIYLQKGVASATRVAAATTQHIKISTTAGDWGADDISVSGNEDGTVTFTVIPAAALACSLASAIP